MIEGAALPKTRIPRLAGGIRFEAVFLEPAREDGRALVSERGTFREVDVEKGLEPGVVVERDFGKIGIR